MNNAVVDAAAAVLCCSAYWDQRTHTHTRTLNRRTFLCDLCTSFGHRKLTSRASIDVCSRFNVFFLVFLLKRGLLMYDSTKGWIGFTNYMCTCVKRNKITRTHTESQVSLSISQSRTQREKDAERQTCEWWVHNIFITTHIRHPPSRSYHDLIDSKT